MRLGHHVDVDEGAVAADDVDALLAQRGDAHLDLAHHLGLRPAGLLQQQVPFVVVGEQVCRAVDQLADLLAGQPGQLLRRVGGEGQAERAALLGVQEHRVGVVGADDHQIRCAPSRYDIGQLDVAGLRHRTGVEGRDLGHVLVRGADESGGVGGVRHQHAVAVHAVAGEPAPVVVEVLAYRADERRVPAEDADGVGHVSRDAAAVDDQIVHQEAQRHLLQVFGQQLLGELARKPHEMVGRDRSGYRDGHEASPFNSLTCLDNLTQPNGPRATYSSALLTLTCAPWLVLIRPNTALDRSALHRRIPVPPQPYPENPVVPSAYPGMLPPPIPYPKRSRWRAVLGALVAIAVVAAAVVAIVLVVRSDDDSAAATSLTTASAKTAIQDYLDALQRGDVEEIARHTLCGLFDAVKESKSDLALADLSSDAFRKQFSKADVTSIDKMVFSSPYQAQVLFTMRVTPAGSRSQPPPREEQAVAQLLAQDNQVLVCSYLLRDGGPVLDQLNESPHAHDPVALGLSMVKPCFSMVSTKSIVAPWM